MYWGNDAASGRQLSATKAASGGEETIVVASTDYLDRPAWRPDGAYIAYAGIVDGNWDLWLSTPDGSWSRRLTSDTQMETNPLWSPDGTTLAYKVAPATQYNPTIENFMTFENGLEQPTVHIWNGPESVQMNDWSPDGRQIAYTAEVISGASGADRVSYANIVSDLSLQADAAVATSSVRIAKGKTLGDRGAVFSPDGSRLVFESTRDGSPDLWILELG